MMMMMIMKLAAQSLLIMVSLFIIKVLSAAFSILYKVLLPRIASCFFTALFLNVHLSFCAVITIITIRPKNVFLCFWLQTAKK